LLLFFSDSVSSWPLTASHTSAAPSSEAATIRLPSGLNWAYDTLSL
jgi:hypothetical protein